MGGRGSGKTRSGAEWVRSQVMAGRQRIALVAETAGDARDVMVEGESGIMAVSWEHDHDIHGNHVGRPRYEPSKRRLTWANGAMATTYAATEPGQLRGPQHDAAWADEVAKWRYDETWDNLVLGLRLGEHPRIVATTTPRPIKLVKDLVDRSRSGVGDVVVTKASTFDNAANLADSFIAAVRRRYEGTRMGRQELSGDLLLDIPGALWSRARIDELRLVGSRFLVDGDNRTLETAIAEAMQRIVVAVDPAASAQEGSDETGIIVAARDEDRTGYVLADNTVTQANPDEWGRAAVLAFEHWDADEIVVEANNGGDMAVSVIQSAALALFKEGKCRRKKVPVTKVHATRGKAIRAEPVSALYEQGRIHHVGTFAQLEDQQCAFTPDFDRKKAGYSPDRLDAAVWAFTDLIVGSRTRAGERHLEGH